MKLAYYPSYLVQILHVGQLWISVLTFQLILNLELLVHADGPLLGLFEFLRPAGEV